MVLEAIYEQDFLDCSYGFRPCRSAHQALEALWDQAMKMGGGYVLELDIQKFFDTLDHSHLRSFLDQRVRDGVIRRAIDKWLKAGVMEEGAVRSLETGTPQGGVVSPILANLYLHEVLDVWFMRDVLPRLRGMAFLIRYADDAVLVFASEQDAKACNGGPSEAIRQVWTDLASREDKAGGLQTSGQWAERSRELRPSRFYSPVG